MDRLKNFEPSILGGLVLLGCCVLLAAPLALGEVVVRLGAWARGKKGSRQDAKDKDMGDQT